MKRRNDKEREIWVLNHEPLYRWWRSERNSMRAFIRLNRSGIDQVIDKELHIESRKVDNYEN